VITALVAVFLLLLVIGMPVAFALALASLAAIAYEGMPLALVVQRMVAAADSFVLLAVPFFLLAGHLMAHSGMARDIIGFAESLLGAFRGGLAHANVATSTLMGGMTGSAVADTASTGTALIPPMVECGYSPTFAAAVTAASSTISVVIPPSVPMIIFCVVTGVSVSQLFIAGLMPGFLMALAMMITISLVARREDLPAGRRSSLGDIGQAFVRSIVPLTLPVVIIGSIRFGIATPTEAAVVAVVYAFLVGKFWYRTIGFRDLRPIILAAASTTGVVMLMIAAASLYGLILTRAQIPQKAAAGIELIADDPAFALLLILLVYLVAGAILDLGANIIILVPILHPAILIAGHRSHSLWRGDCRRPLAGAGHATRRSVPFRRIFNRACANPPRRSRYAAVSHRHRMRSCHHHSHTRNCYLAPGHDAALNRCFEDLRALPGPASFAAPRRRAGPVRFPERLAQDQLVERQVGDRLTQPAVLELELLRPLHLVELQYAGIRCASGGTSPATRRLSGSLPRSPSLVTSSRPPAPPPTLSPSRRLWTRALIPSRASRAPPRSSPGGRPPEQRDRCPQPSLRLVGA
jgi:C4-dicarboxylate transporter, DctM subunit